MKSNELIDFTREVILTDAVPRELRLQVLDLYVRYVGHTPIHLSHGGITYITDEKE